MKLKRCRFLLLGFVLLMSVGPVQAETFAVTNNEDEGSGSLRQAIINANAAGGANTIVWSGAGGSIAPFDPLPDITADLTLDGSNVSSSVVLRSNKYFAFSAS